MPVPEHFRDLPRIEVYQDLMQHEVPGEDAVLCYLSVLDRGELETVVRHGLDRRPGNGSILHLMAHRALDVLLVSL